MTPAFVLDLLTDYTIFTVMAFGLHIVLCVLFAYVLRLNQVIVYAAANLSMPPLIPVLGLISVELGERLRHGRFLGLDLALDRRRDVAQVVARPDLLDGLE